MTVEQLWQKVPGGSGTYIKELSTALAHRDDVRVAGVTALHRGAERHGLPAGMPVVASRLPRAALYEAWTRLRRPAVPRAGHFDVIHATTWALPPASSPLVVTVHDVAFLRDPGHFTPRGVAFFTRALAITAAEASAIIVPSEVTAHDCVAAGLDRDRITVIPHGVGAPTATAGDADRFRAAHHLDRDYVLWCGTLEPRKNLVTLLAAFEAAIGTGADLDLVIAGPLGWGDADEQVREAVARLGSQRVRRLGYLSSADLGAAYRGARVFAFPSTWEGFGLPVLEAMSYGTPVVTTSGTSMQEISGGGALVVDPLDADEMAQALLAAAGDRHDELAQGAVANAAAYTWEAAAAATAHVYRSVGGRHG